jgi:hypothetical protein
MKVERKFAITHCHGCKHSFAELRCLSSYKHRTVDLCQPSTIVLTHGESRRTVTIMSLASREWRQRCEAKHLDNFLHQTSPTPQHRPLISPTLLSSPDTFVSLVVPDSQLVTYVHDVHCVKQQIEFSQKDASLRPYWTVVAAMD